MPQMTRKKVRWATKKRKGASRKWKTRWIMVAKRPPAAEKGEKKA